MALKNFIVFEGIDGSGTTTQIKILERRAQGKVVASSEPTKLETGLFLRKMLKGEFKVDERTAAHLFAADRCEHVWGPGGLAETAASGKIAASDRYFFSSLAYQSGDSAAESARVVNSLFPLPEILFYLKIDPEVSLSRVAKRGGEREIYENIERQRKCAARYEEIAWEYSGAKGEGMTIATIDASRGVEEVAEEVWRVARKLPILKE